MSDLSTDYVKRNLVDFVDDLRSTHGSNLASVILYGPHASGSIHGEPHILIALHKIAPEDLRNAHAANREWTRMGHPAPVYFTVSELENAADVFPIEFSRMEASRVVLFGTDVLHGLEFSDHNLRHQTEYELRSALIRLRRRYIEASTSAEGLQILMARSISGIADVFRAVLILHGLNAPSKLHEIIASTAKHLKIDGRPFEKVLNIRENNFTVALDETLANELFGQYLEQIENVIDAVDSLSQATKRISPGE